MNLQLESKCTFIFPGSNMDYSKTLNAMSDEHLELLRKYCAIVEEKYKVNIWEYITVGDESGRDKELKGQIAVLVISCVIAEIFRRCGINPSMLLGYSMGLYAACVCAGALSFESALSLVIKAYKVLDSMYTEHEGGMVCVIGFTTSFIKKIIQEMGIEEFVEIANENAAYSVVVSGFKVQIVSLAKRLRAENAVKVIEIDTKIPYHTKFTLKGAKTFKTYLKNFEIGDLEVPIMSCIDQKIIKDSAVLRDELYLNYFSNISWKKSMEILETLGYTKFFEANLGNDLSRISKYISKKFEFFSYLDLFKILSVSR